MISGPKTLPEAETDQCARAAVMNLDESSRSLSAKLELLMEQRRCTMSIHMFKKRHELRTQSQDKAKSGDKDHDQGKEIRAVSIDP